MKIESTDQDVRNLLSSGYYRIPRFQRPYSWTRENIQEFWDDIVKDAPENYFIGSISEMYASLGRRLFEAKDTQEAMVILKEAKTKLRERIPVIDEVKALFPAIIYTENQTKQRGLVKYILSRFQSHSVKSVTINFDGMTIEHLVPQSAIDGTIFTEDIVGQLGNLILVPSELNDKLADRPFKEKRKILEANDVKIPDEFAKLTEITPENIRERTSNLAVQAYEKVWRI